MRAANDDNTGSISGGFENQNEILVSGDNMCATAAVRILE